MSAQAGLNDGLVAYYQLNGNANDASGNGNNAVFVGSVTNASDRFGDSSMAAFVGLNGRISLPSTSALQSSAATFSFWYQPETNILTDQPNNSICVLLNSGPDHHPLLFMNASPGSAPPGTPAMTLGYWWYGFYTANYIIPIGQWTHFCLVINGSSRSVYINGSLMFQTNNYFGNTAYPVTDIGNFPGDPNTHSARGAFDDVRIYNRALSVSEVQQLYSQSDIGPAPASPTVIQTNRTPSSTELGAQTSGSFKVFTNGVFQTNVLLNPNLMTIVLTHGWNDSSDTWPSTMASQFVAAGISANIVAWDWRNDARQNWPVTALLKTPNQGNALGVNLRLALGAGYNQPIHFIGHSFGTEVNAAAANYLHTNGFAWANTQMTLFDEAEIGNDLRIVSPTTWNLGWIKPLPDNFAHSDNYVSLVGELQEKPETVNVILTEDQPNNFYLSADALWNALKIYHAVPCQWFGQTILNPSGSVMGDVWSFERNSNFTSPAGGTYFEQQGSGLSVSQILPAATDIWQQFESMAFRRDVVMFFTLKGVNASVQAVGDVVAHEIDNVLNDSTPAYITTPATIGISSYAPPTPDFWSPQLILQTHPLILPGPLNSPKPHPLDGPDPTPSNSPAYAWLPMTIPTNATTLSFDFQIQGNGASDSLAAAVNGTNVFSLPLNLLQTNVVMNSGTIDVSAYAGTNVELFLGIIGGTSTNASVTVSGVRVYSTMLPSLQAQASGGNSILSWPLSAQNFSLQTTTNLADPNSWTTLTNIPAIVNLQNTVTNSIYGGAQFYRLKK